MVCHAFQFSHSSPVTLSRSLPVFHSLSRPSVYQCLFVCAFTLFILSSSLSSSANHQAYVLREEVWSQRESRDREPAGCLPVREYASGHAGSQSLLGKCFWRSWWDSQPVRYAAHALPRLRPIGPGTNCQLITGRPQWHPLQVSTLVPLILEDLPELGQNFQ